MVESIDVVLSTQLEVTAEAQIIVVRDHNSLEHLDYESSGHTGFASKEYADTELEKKVDKVEGKGLSQNDYTNDEKTKLGKIKFFVGDTYGLENQLIQDFNVSHDHDYILYYGNCEDHIGTRNCVAIASFFSNQICCVEIDHESLTFLLCDNPRSETPTWRETNMIYNMLSSIARKVDRVQGKGLSTNDFTNEYKIKLDEAIVGDDLIDAINNEIQQRLFDGETIDDELLPDSVKNVIEFTKQVTGSDFMNQILATELGTTVWIAANKSYTGETYYRKFAINVDGTQAGLQLFNPKENTIYVGKTDNNCYKWSGSNLVEVSKSIGLGESSTTAYAGNKGKANADAIANLQENKMNKTDVINYNNLSNKPIIETDIIPQIESKQIYKYSGSDTLTGLINGDLFKVKQESTEIERTITSYYPNNLSASSLPIIIKNGFKIVFNSDYTSNILYTATMYNSTNGIDHFPQIRYSSGGYVYIILNSTGASIKLHNSWNGGFVESFSNEYVTWDKTTRTLLYIGNEESVFDTLSTNTLAQADCTITTIEMSNAFIPKKLTFGDLKDFPDYNEEIATKADIAYVDLKVPTPPTTAGTYRLQVVVDAQGNATYSWVA